jgi:hypothetical protein
MTSLPGDLAAVVDHDGLDLRPAEIDPSPLQHAGDRSASR